MTISEKVHYESDQLEVDLPGDLKKDRNSMYFMRPKRGWKKPGILTACIDIMSTKDMIDVMRREIADTPVRGEWMGVHTIIVRRGPIQGRSAEEVEMRATRDNPITGDVFHFRNLLVQKDGVWVYAAFGGRGDCEDFDRRVEEVLKSIKRRA